LLLQVVSQDISIHSTESQDVSLQFIQHNHQQQQKNTSLCLI